MLANAFIGKTEEPTSKELAAALGPAGSLWIELVTALVSECGIDVQEWNSYSPKAGWSQRLKRQKRTILYLSPCHHAFRAAFALGDKAVQAACRSDLPQNVINNIKQSRRYAEGTAVRLDVTGAQDIAAVKKIAAIKLEH